MGTIMRPLMVETGKSDEEGIDIDMETLIFLNLINGEIMRGIIRSKPVVVEVGKGDEVDNDMDGKTLYFFNLLDELGEEFQRFMRELLRSEPVTLTELRKVKYLERR